MFHIIKPGTNFDFASKSKLFISISIVLIIITIILFFKKGLNYGIDFTGGAEIQVNIPVSTSELRKTLEDGGLESFKIQQIGEKKEQDFIIRARQSEDLNQVASEIQSILNKKDVKFEIERIDVVGPAAGNILRKKGFLAMFYALFAILIYVGVRFDSRYAPGAVIALFHDTTIIIGFFILTGIQFDLTILAAILALIGYSNNDTIIVYDRIRETIYHNPDLSIEKAVNKAINSTLGRTIMTSITTLLVVSSLYFFGGSVIKNFALTLMIGIIIGTYSSIFIASSMIIIFTRYRNNMKKKSRYKRQAYNVRSDPKTY